MEEAIASTIQQAQPAAEVAAEHPIASAEEEAITNAIQQDQTPSATP